MRQVPPENLVFWMSDDDARRPTSAPPTSSLRKGRCKAPRTRWPPPTWTSPWVPSDPRRARAHGLSARRRPARILLTDMSLVAKRTGTAPGEEPGGQGGRGVGARHGHRAARGVEVSLVRKSGQAVARCTTGGAAAASWRCPRSGGHRAAVRAHRSQGRRADLPQVQRPEAEIADSDVQGEPYRAERPYRAAVYGDRGVYRPGDTAHVVGVVRDARTWRRRRACRWS